MRTYGCNIVKWGFAIGAQCQRSKCENTYYALLFLLYNRESFTDRRCWRGQKSRLVLRMSSACVSSCFFLLFMPFPSKILYHTICNSNGRQVHSFVPSLFINSPVALSITGWPPTIFHPLKNCYVFLSSTSVTIVSPCQLSFLVILHQYPHHYPFSLSHSLLLGSRSFQPSLPPHFTLLL